jgi:hypothetical protein
MSAVHLNWTGGFLYTGSGYNRKQQAAEVIRHAENVKANIAKEQ